MDRDDEKYEDILNETLQFYDSRAQEYVSETKNLILSETQELFLGRIPEGGKILDFGCGSGRDSKQFLEKGFAVHAIDGSEEMCRLASEYTGINVERMLFDELEAIEAYDGIWACTSILHVEKEHLPTIIKKMTNAVKSGGIIYASFKHGTFEGIIGERYFTYLTECSFKDLLKGVPELRLEKTWITKDVRTEKEGEQWLNVFLIKE